MSVAIGVCLAAAHIGYVVLFYVVGRRLGVWAPQDLQYSDTMSTALPWVFPLTIGIYAASSEEFLFRHVFRALPAAVDEVESAGGGAAGICMGVFALELSAGAGIHSRD